VCPCQNKRLDRVRAGEGKKKEGPKRRREGGGGRGGEWRVLGVAGEKGVVSWGLSIG